MSKKLPLIIVGATLLALSACASKAPVSGPAVAGEPAPPTVECAEDEDQATCDSKLMQAYQYYLGLWGKIFLK